MQLDANGNDTIHITHFVNENDVRKTISCKWKLKIVTKVPMTNKKYDTLYISKQN